jgi:hypothetical protein
MSTRTRTRGRVRLGGACAGMLMVAMGQADAQPAQPQVPGSIDAMVWPSPLPIPTYTDPDVRELAWIAWTAGRDRVHSAQPMLERMVAKGLDGDPSSPPVDFALDALIQLRARLAPDLLARIAEHRVVEGLILLSYLDDGTGDDVLLATLGRHTSYEWFAAANLLLRRRAPGFAASLLEGLRLQARVTVSPIGAAGWGSGVGVGGNACGGMSQHPGMPPWPSYDLTHHPDDVVLAAGPTPVHYRRRVSAAGFGPDVDSEVIGARTARDRLRYVAALTGWTLALRDDQDRTVRHRPGLDVDAVAAGLRRDIERRHRLLVRDLVAGGFVTPIEARRLSVRVDVSVHHVTR